MVPLNATFYVGDMATDLAVLLAANFRRIRQRRAGTQERFSELTGLSQGQISELETAKRWKHVQKVGEVLERAGIDPAELLSPEPAEPPPAYVVEAAELLRSADETTRDALLQIMRSVAAQGQRARG